MAERFVQPPPPASCGEGDWKSRGARPYFMPQVAMPANYPMNTRPSAPSIEPNANLYIHNVPKDAQEDELRELFSAYGTVQKIRLKVNQKIGPQAVYAFVTFSNANEAQTALQQLNGYDMRSRRLRIEFQRSKEDDNRLITEDYDQSGTSVNYEVSEHQHRAQMWSNDYHQPRKQNEYSGTHIADPHLQMSTQMTHYSQAYPGPSVTQHEAAPDEEESSAKRSRNYPPAMHQQAYSRQLQDSIRQPSVPSRRDQGHEPHRSAPRQPITVNLCEILQTIHPHLFERPLPQHFPPKDQPFARSPQRSDPPLSHESQRVHDPPERQQRPPIDKQTPQPYYSDPKPGIHSVERSLSTSRFIPGTPCWTGLLLRNGKKKTFIEICYLSGSFLEMCLNQEIQSLNISHRSAWDDIEKKAPLATVYLRLHDFNISEGTKTEPLTPHHKELNRKHFSEHMHYLNEKKRAGVAALQKKFHLYILSFESQLGAKYQQQVMQYESSLEFKALGFLISGQTTTITYSDQRSMSAQDGKLMGSKP